MRGRSYRFLLAGVLAVVSAVYGAAPRPQPRSRIVVVKAFYAVPASERAYAASLADGTASILSRNGVRVDLVADGGLVVIESAADTEVEVPEGFREVRCKQYRVTKFTMWRKNRGEET